MDVQQQAEAKIETFPYTKYDTIHATVTDVSNDEKKGLIYVKPTAPPFRWKSKPENGA